MKKILIILGAALLLWGCEVIKEADRLIPLPLSGSARTHVLIEYTGFRCVNCPKASETAQELHSLYGDQLIVVAMHPASNPFTQGLYDYTCPASDIYYKQCGGTAQTSFPTGNINLQATESGYLLDPSHWGTQLNHLANDSTDAKIDSLRATMDPQTRQVTIAIEALYDVSRTEVVYWVVEDSILGVQAMPDGSVNTEYYHRHVLRTAETDATALTLDENWNQAHCSLVAVLINKQDRHIENAKQTPITTKQQ